MKNELRICAMIVIVTLAATAQVASHAPTMQTASVSPAVSAPADKAVLRVNGAVFTDRDLAREMLNVFPYAKEHGGKFPKDSEPQIRKQAMRNLEFEELVYQDAVRRGITVTPAKLNQAVKDFRAQFDSQAEYQQYLKAEQNGSAKELRTKIHRAIVIDQALKALIDKKARFTDAALKTF